MPTKSPEFSMLPNPEDLELDRLCPSSDMEHMDRRIRKTRQRLQAGLLLLMKEKPLSQITMREICRRVDVGRSTPYTHYRDVQDILEQMESVLYEELSTLLATYPAGGSVPEKTAWFTRLYTLAQGNGLLLHVLLSFKGDPDFLQKLLTLCEERICGILSPGAQDAAWRSTFLTGALVSMVRQWVSGASPESPEDMARLTVRFLHIA